MRKIPEDWKPKALSMTAREVATMWHETGEVTEADVQHVRQKARTRQWPPFKNARSSAGRPLAKIPKGFKPQPFEPWARVALRAGVSVPTIKARFPDHNPRVT